jgi:hypothetical protein
MSRPRNVTIDLDPEAGVDVQVVDDELDSASVRSFMPRDAGFTSTGDALTLLVS